MQVRTRRRWTRRGNSTRTKVALRRAVEKLVPPAIVERPKMGFPTPHRQWLAGPMFGWVDHLVAEARCGHLLDLEYARRLLREHREGHDHARKIWTIMVFCIWYSQIGADSKPFKARS
nr:asparagine synthase-related protein [Glycomyces sp. L485]